MPLTAVEIASHPAFQESVIWDLKPTTKGKCAVAQGRGGPFNIAYEIHGVGDLHVVWIMGLGAHKWYWQRQTKDFGHDDADKYSCLLFDNRGIGESDKPIQRYSTSEMAKDVLHLLNHVGWTDDRSVHVVGSSMGGMIAQELAYLEPTRVASLSLVSTCAQLMNTVGYLQNMRNRINLFIPRSIDGQIAEIKSRVSESWLLAPDEDGNFPTNGDRYAAQELAKRLDVNGFQRKGFLCQLAACGYHRKSPAQLQEIADNIGRERIQVVHGDMDNLITLPHAKVLWREMNGDEGGVTKVIFKGRGHHLPFEERRRFKRVIAALIDETAAFP